MNGYLFLQSFIFYNNIEFPSIWAQFIDCEPYSAIIFVTEVPHNACTGNKNGPSKYNCSASSQPWVLFVFSWISGIFALYEHEEKK